MIPLTEDEIEAFERRIAAANGRQLHDLYWTHEEMGRALATIDAMRSVRDPCQRCGQ